jgi:hypothetical protein
MTQEDDGDHNDRPSQEGTSSVDVQNEDTKETDDGSIHNSPSIQETDVTHVMESEGATSDELQEAPAPVEETIENRMPDVDYDGDVETATGGQTKKKKASIMGETLASGAVDNDDDKLSPMKTIVALATPRKTRLDSFDSLLDSNDYSVPLQSTSISETKRGVKPDGDFDFQKLVSFENEKKDQEILVLTQSLGESDDSAENLSHESLHSLSADSDFSDYDIPALNATEIGLASPDNKTGHYSKHKRVSSAVDLETGKRGGARRSRVSRCNRSIVLSFFLF